MSSNINETNSKRSLSLSLFMIYLFVSFPDNEIVPINRDSVKNVKSILEELLQHEKLKSQEASASNEEESLNIFEGVNLDDDSITNYVSRLKDSEADLILDKGSFCGTSDSKAFFDRNSGAEFLKVKDVEEILSAKDTTIAILAAELDSLKEAASNHSTLSFNTSTTEYKQFQEEYQNKVII